MKNKKYALLGTTLIMPVVSITTIISCKEEPKAKKSSEKILPLPKRNKSKLDTTKEYITNIYNHKQKINKLITIGLDGLPGWLLKKHPKFFRALLKNSIYTLESENEYKETTLSEGNWATLYSGTHPKDHGIYNEKPDFSGHYKKIDAKYPSEYGKNPTIFYQFNKKYPREIIYNSVDWEAFSRVLEKNIFVPHIASNFNFKQNDFRFSLLKTYKTADGSSRRVFKDLTNSKILASVLESENKKILANFHFDQLDHIGHFLKWGSDVDLIYMKELGQKLLKIIHKIQEQNHHKRDLIFAIIADHGGIPGTGSHDTKIHNRPRANQKSEHFVKDVPMIFIGDGIKGRNVLTGKIKNINFAATVAKLMNFNSPTFWANPIDLRNIKQYGELKVKK